MIKLRFILTFVLLSLALFAGSKKPTVVVSVAPERFFVLAIAKNSVHCTTLVPSYENPEVYRLTQKQVQQINHSNLFIPMGLYPFETPWTTLPTHVSVLSLRPCFTLNSNGDVNVWLSFENAEKMANTLYHALCEKFPENQALYTKNYQHLQKQFAKFQQEMNYLLTPYQQRYLLTNSPFLTYFANDYSLQVLPVSDSALSTDSLYTTAHLHHLQTIFINTQLPDNTTRELAKKMRAQLIIIHPYSENWFHNMLSIASKITASYQVVS